MRLLDLFCGAGGAAVGYRRAGFEVVGVDVVSQPRYPFRFIQSDALFYTWANRRLFGFEYQAIHASPPCQHASSLRFLYHRRKSWPDLIADTRAALEATGVPWVIENVPGSALRYAATFCGSAFGLGTRCRDGQFRQLRRHRMFESSFPLLTPPCAHRGQPVGVYGNGGGTPATRRDGRGMKAYTGNAAERREAMGIDWMCRHELSQAIPPPYTEFIGRALMGQLRAGVA